MPLAPKQAVIQGLLCLLAGGLLPLAFAPYDLYLIAFIALALLFSAWSRSTPRRAFLYGYVFGLGMFGSGLSWLHISINTFGGTHIALAWLLTFLLVAFLSLYPALVGYLARRCFNCAMPVQLILVFPALWGLAEWCRAWLLTGFPWLSLGYSQMDTPLANLAPLFGVYGVSWASALLAGLLASVFAPGLRHKISATLGIALIGLLCWALGQHDFTERKSQTASVALIQGGIPQALKWLPEYRQPSLDLYKRLSQPHWGKDLIIWPETAIPAYYHQAADVISELHKNALAYNTDILVGLPVQDPHTADYYNSVILLNQGSSFYHKRHLVPFGEYLPLAFLLTPIIRQMNIPIADFSPGDTAAPLLTASRFTFGMSICYEDIFGEQVIDALPQAEILVNVSNDAWFGDSAAPHQHLQMARMRALETGRYMLRATNTGISAIIDEKGRILSRSPQFEAAVLAGKISLFGGMTPYARWGNMAIVLLLLAVLLLCKYFFKTNDR